MPIEKITSRKSSVVKNAAALLQKAENRSEAGLFMAEGARLCADAARSQTEIAACFFTENAAKKYKDYLDPVLKQTEHAYCIEEHIAPMLSDTKNPQGIFCAFAAGDPLAVVNNLSTFIFSLIRAIGLILLGWGVVQVGLSFQSHDPSQRSQGFLTLAGGLIVTFAKEILDLITA